jgi:hypothetical protein
VYIARIENGYCWVEDSATNQRILNVPLGISKPVAAEVQGDEVAVTDEKGYVVVYNIKSGLRVP